MSRSRRKTPIIGMTGAHSEREDKKRWHGRWRSVERDALKHAVHGASLDAHIATPRNQVGSTWDMAKDGKRWWSPGQMQEMADFMARCDGVTPSEVASLRKRWKHRFSRK